MNTTTFAPAETLTDEAVALNFVALVELEADLAELARAKARLAADPRNIAVAELRRMTRLFFTFASKCERLNAAANEPVWVSETAAGIAADAAAWAADARGCGNVLVAHLSR